jgi:hypothetical protein
MHRKGAAAATLLVMLAVVNLAVIGAIAASGDEAQVGAMRAETCRAFYAAESGARVVIKLTSENLTLPAAGSTLSLGGSATATYISLPAMGQPGEAVVQGTDGNSSRRIRVTLSSS